jgi:hypothetical protein
MIDLAWVSPPYKTYDLPDGGGKKKEYFLLVY